MFKKILAVIGFLAFSFTASAGLITDTTNGSFIDETTGLEWMDFGINNKDTYEYVSSQLDSGDEYEGWRLATKDDVYSMMANAFLGLGARYENANNHLPGSVYVNDGEGIGGSVLYHFTDIMGYNRELNSGLSNEFQYSFGLFSGTDGLSRIEMHRMTGSYYDLAVNDDAFIMDYTNYDSKATSTSSSYSTLLIKNSSVTSVPEPSTLAIFALGIFGIASRKLLK